MGVGVCMFGCEHRTVSSMENSDEEAKSDSKRSGISWDCKDRNLAMFALLYNATVG